MLATLDHDGKVALLGGAFAMIFLSQGLEACPLVLLESMACGTPVLGLRNGPVPEIVTQGVGGICVDDVAGLTEGIPRVSELDRAAVELAVRRFDVSCMVDGYLRIFDNATRRDRR